jgi:uncharacterized protein (TIGR03435 family)
MHRGFAPYRRLSHAQVELAGMRVMQRLRKEPMWGTAAAPLAAAGDSAPAARSWSFVAVPAAVGIALALAGSAVIYWVSIDRSTPDAVVETSDGSLFRISGGGTSPLEADERLAFGDTVRTNGGQGGTFVLADGSRVEMRSQSELALERADDGVRIRLTKGGIIVNAAKQRSGHLSVQTKDVTVSVAGTVFFVDAKETGSRVAVIEGEVRVQRGATENTLLPGQQFVTNPQMLAAPVIEEVAWSHNAQAHVALLQQTEVVAPGVPPRTSAEPRQAFENVSIRLAAPLILGPRSGGPPPPSGAAPPPLHTGAPCIGLELQVDPRRIAIRSIPLHGLIALAYGRPCQAMEQLSGGPAWVKVDGYDVEATLPAGSQGYSVPHLRNGNAPQLQAMLQTLLADRFKLVLRREMREASAYDLVVVKEGMVKPSPDQQNPPDPKPEPMSGPPAPMLGMGWTTMFRFAGTLQMYVGRPVIDRTGLKGQFDIRLRFPDLAGTFLPPAELRTAMGEQLPSKLQEELGLKLEPSRGPVEFMVIDYVARPSEN